MAAERGDPLERHVDNPADAIVLAHEIVREFEPAGRAPGDAEPRFRACSTGAFLPDDVREAELQELLRPRTGYRRAGRPRQIDILLLGE